MPGTRCTVAVCNNSFEKTKKAGLKITYHKFPKAQPYRNIWIQNTRRAGIWNPDSCHVCSMHFTKDDFNPSSTSLEKLGRLKPTAVPSLYLLEPPPIGNVCESNHRQNRVKKKIINEILHPKTTYSTIYIQPFEIKEEIGDEFAYCESLLTNDSYNVSTSNANSQYEVSDIYPGSSDECIESEEFQEVHAIPQVSYITVKDEFIPVKNKSTQTDTDSLSQNYTQLMKKNEILETEIVNWRIKYKRLVANMRFLESKIQRLSLNSTQV